MPSFTTRFTAAFAAILMAVVSVNALVTVPPASAQVATYELA